MCIIDLLRKAQPKINCKTMKYTNLKQLARSTALSGLAALVLGCGGGGGVQMASEAAGRAQIRTKLLADKNAERILDYTEDPEPVEPEPGKFTHPDFEVLRNDKTPSYVEYTSSTDTNNQVEIQLFYNNGWDYLYTGPSSASAVGTAIQDYSTANYIGQIPTP